MGMGFIEDSPLCKTLYGNIPSILLRECYE
jgi:hypothetical protein